MRYGRKHTGALNVEEINIMSGGVDHGPESHGVRDLSVEPDVLVGGEEPSETGADDTDDVPQHGHKDHGTIECEDKTSTSGRPDRPGQPVQGSQLLVSGLEGEPLLRGATKGASRDAAHT